MDRKIIRNFLLFLAIVSTIFMGVSCQPTPINKSVTISFLGDDNVGGVTINDKNSSGVVGKNIKYTQKAGETFSFDVETDALYMVKSISGQVSYRGGKTYAMAPTENAEVKIETVRRVSSDPLFSVRGDSGVETVTFKENGETSTVTRIATSATVLFEKVGSGTLTIRPKSGYKIENVRGASLLDATKGEYAVSDKSVNVIVTTIPDSTYVNTYKTIVINNQGGEGETSVIFFKEGKFYADNKDGSREITSIPLPIYGDYIVSFGVGEKDVVIDKGEGVEGEVIGEDYTLPTKTNFVNIVSSNGDEAIDVNGNIKTSVTPFSDCVEYKAVWDTEEIELPTLRQNLGNRDEYTKKFVGWGLKQNDPTVDLKATDDSLTIPFTPDSTVKLYDKWVNESYTLKINIIGETNGKLLIVRDREEEYKNGDVLTLSKQRDLIFRLIPNDTYTYTHTLTDDNDSSKKEILFDNQNQSNGEFLFKKETVNKYSSLTLNVKFGRFADAELSGNITLVKDVEIDAKNYATLPSLTLRVDPNNTTHDTWDDNKLRDKVDITDKVFISVSSTSQNPLTYYGETLKAYLTYDGSDGERKRAIVSIEGTPTVTLAPNSVVYINTLPMSYLSGVSENDSLTIKSVTQDPETKEDKILNSAVIKDSVMFTFSKVSDENNIKNRFNGIVINKTDLIKERTLQVTENGTISFFAEKDTNLIFTPLFEIGFALDYSDRFVDSNVTVSEIDDKFIVYSSEYSAKDSVSLNVTSREKSIVVRNIDVVDEGLRNYNVGDNSSKIVRIELQNNGYENSAQGSGVEPLISILVSENGEDKWVDIKDRSIGGVGFTWAFNVSNNIFTISLRPNGTLTLPLSSTSLKITIPSRAFDGETSDVEVLYKDNKPEIPFIIYPSTTLSGATTVVENISDDRVKDKGQITLSSESALNSGLITENGYDITEYVTVGNTNEPLSSFALKATLFVDKVEGNEGETAPDVKIGHIAITGIAAKALDESLLNFSLPAKLFKGFEEDEKTLRSTSNAKISILKTISLTFSAAEDDENGQKNKLSSVIINDSATLKGETLDISSDEGRSASIYTIEEETIRFSLTFENQYALDNIDPFSPKELVTKVSSETDQTEVYEINGVNLKEDTELIITSSFKTVALESTTLSLYNVGDTSSKTSEFTLVASGYTLTGVTVTPTVSVDITDRNGNVNTVPISRSDVGGVGFNIVEFKKESENSFKLTISPRNEITTSLTASRIKITIPRAAFTNADIDVEVSGLNDKPLIIYPRFNAQGSVTTVKGIGDEDALTSRVYTLTSRVPSNLTGTPWSDDKVGENEANGKDITSFVKIGENEISTYGLSAIMYFDASLTTKTTAKVAIKGAPNTALTKSDVSFELDSSFFRGFEDSSDEVQRTSEATLEVKDSVNLTIKASNDEIGTTDQLDSITLSATSYVKERTQNISTADDKTATIVIEKDRVIEFEPKIKTGYALDNNDPFPSSSGMDSKPNANNKYQIPPQQADYTLTVKTIEMSVTATEMSELEFNVGDGTNVKKQIPLMVKGYALSETLPSSARPTVFVSVVDTDIKEDITKTNGVGGRGFNATIAKNGNGLVLTISPKSTLNASYKMSKISVTLPRTIFTNANEDVVVSGDNIDKIRFVVYPSYSTSSDVKLINGVNSADLTVSPEFIITSDTKWKQVAAEGEDITDKVFIDGTVLSGYNLNARLTTNESENDGKTARVVIEGTPNKDTLTKSEPITLKIDATMLEGYDELGEKEINCRQSAATLLIDKSIELKFKAPDLASDGSNEDARKLKSVFVRADGLKDKEYALVNGEVSIFVKEGKNVTFRPTYEVGYAGSSTPFASSVSVVNSGDSNFPYRVVLQNVVLESPNVTIIGSSILKNVMASNPNDLTFRVSSSSTSDVKTLTFTVDGYELADSIENVKPRVYALINSEEVLLTDDSKKDLLGGAGFNVSMQKSTDGVVLTIRIAPKDRLTQHLELSKIKVVLPISTFKNESDGVEDVVVSGLDNTNIVIYPSVSATGVATLVQNVSTDELVTEPVVSLISDAMWEIQDEGEDIKDLLSVNNQSLSRATLISSALLVKDGTDSTGKTALIKFSGTPTEAIPTLSSLAYAFDTSYFAGKFTEDVGAPVSVSVPSNSSRIAVYPAQKITFKVPSLVTTTDGDNEDTRKLKSVNVRQSENIKGRTITLNDAKEAVVYVQRAKSLNAVLTFEDGYSLSSNNAYSTSPIIEVRGLGTDGNPLTIADNILSSDTTITVTSIKQGLTLSDLTLSDDSEQQNGVKYDVGDTSSKSYKFKVVMEGYTKRSSISSTPRVMTRTINGDLINITNTTVGGVGFNVTADTTSLTDGFYITISPKAALTSPLPNGTIVIYLPSTYIEGATSEIEVVGGENLRSFNIYPSLNLSGTVNLVKGIDTKDLVATTTFKLVSDAPFSESYIASSRLVTPPSTSESSDDNKEVGESYMLSNSDISEYMSVGSDAFLNYGNSATISIDSSDSSGKTAIITISGASTKVLSSLSDVNISLPISYFKDYVQADEPLIKATSTAKMDISDSVSLIFKRNTTSEDKGKLTKVTVSSTDRIKEVSHTFTSAEDTFETSVESNVATRFTLEYEKGYYIDTYAPFTITPSVEITNVDDKLTTFEIPQSTLKSSTVIVVNTVKQQVIMDGVLEGYFEYFIGDSTDTKLVISSHVAGLIVKDNIPSVVPTVNLNVNGTPTNITSTAIGGVGFNVAIEKRTDRDGFKITLSPKGPITESLVVSELTITLPKALFENGDADYNLDNLDSSMIFYPSATATGSVNLYYFEEIPEDTIVTLTSETPWSTVVIGNELDITNLIRIGSYNGKKLKDYGETLKAMLSIDPSDSFRKTALVKFSGVPQVLQKEPQKVLFDFTPNLFSGFEGEDFLLDPTSSVEFSVVESPNRSAVVNTEDVSDITYSVSSEASSDKRVFRVLMNGYALNDNISSVTPLVYVVDGEDETLISDPLIGGAGFNVSMVKNDEGNGVSITLSPKGAFTSSLELSKIKVVLPSSTFKNQIADVVVDGLDNTNIVIYPAVTASGEVKFVQNIADTLLNAEPIITLTSTSPWSSSIPTSGKEIKDIISIEGDTNLLSLFGDDFKATLTKDEADIEGKTAYIKFSGTPISALSELTVLNYDFDTSYFDGTFVATGSESVDVSVIDNTSKLIISPSHKITIKASSENEKDRLNKIKVLKSENIKERDTITLPQSRTTSVYAEDSKALDVVLEFDTGYSLASDKPYTTTPEIVVTGLGTTGSPMSIASDVIKNDVEVVVSSVRKSIYLTKVAQGSTSSGSEAKGIEYSVNDDKTKAFTFVLSMDGYSKATNISESPRVEIRKADGTKLDVTDAFFGGVGFDVKTNTESSASGMTITISPKGPLTMSLPTGSVVITIPQSFIKDADGDIEVVSGDEYRAFKILPSLSVSGNASLVKGVADTSLINTQTFTLTSETPFVDKSIGISALVRVGDRTLRDYGTGLKATYKLDASDKTNKTVIVTITGTPTVALTTSSNVSINQLPLTYFEGFEAETNKINSTSSDAKMDISDSLTLTIRKNSSDADKGKLTKVTIGKTPRIKGVAYNISPTSTGVVRKIVEKGVAQHFTFAYDNDYFIDDTAPFTTSPNIVITGAEGKLYEYDIASDVLTADTSITVNTVKKGIVFDGTDDALKFKVGDDGEVKASINTLLNGLVIKEDITGVVPTITVNDKNITEALGGAGFNVALSKRADDKNGFTLELSPKAALTESLVLSSYKVSLPSSLFENDTRDTVKNYDVENIASKLIIYPSITATGSVETIINREVESDTTIMFTSETAFSEGNVKLNGDITTFVTIGEGDESKPLTDYGKGLSAKMTIDPTDTSNKTVIVTFKGTPQTLLQATVMNFNINASYFAGFESEKEAITTSSNVQFTVNEVPGDPIPLITVNGKDLTHSSMKDTTLSVTIPEEGANKDLYLIISNPQYDSLPSPTLAGYEVPTKTANNLLSEYMSPFAVDTEIEDEYCDTPRMEEEFQKALEEEQYALMAEAMSNDYAISTQAANVDYEPTWKNPYADLNVGDPVILGDEKYLTPSTPEPKPGLYRTAVKGYEKVPASLRFRRKVPTPNGEKELLIVVEDDVWEKDLSFVDSEITRQIDDAFVEQVADAFLKNGEDDLYGTVGNCYGQEWGKIDNADRVKNYYISKRKDGTTYSENGEYIGVTNQIVLFFARLDGVTTEKGSTYGYFSATHLKCNSTSTLLSNQSICLLINAYYAAFDLDRCESTCAHEFQHAIHNYQRKMRKGYNPNGTYINSMFNSNHESWVNEMFSTLVQDAVCDILSGYGPAYEENNGIALPDTTKERVPSYFTAQRYGLTDWRRIQNVYSPDNTAITYGLVYSFGSYIVRNYGIGFIKNYLASDENEFASSADMPKEANGWSNSKSNALNMLVQAIKDSDKEAYKDLTWEDILQGWAAAILLSDKEDAKVPYKLVKNNGSDYWWRGIYNYGIKVPSINYFNYRGPATMWEGAERIRTTGPVIFNSDTDRTYDMLPQGNQFYGNSNTYVLLGKNLTSGTHTYTVDGDTTYKYSLVLK